MNLGRLAKEVRGGSSWRRIWEVWKVVGAVTAPEGEHQAGKRHGILRKEVLKGRVWG